MPIIAQGAVGTLSADLSGVDWDVSPAPTVTVQTLAGVVQAGFPVGGLVRDGLGLYHYDWDVPLIQPAGTFDVHFEGTVNGAVWDGWDTVEVVASTPVPAGSLTFLEDPDDLLDVLKLLGLTELDLQTSELAGVPFAVQAELRVKLKVRNWIDQIAEPQGAYMLRLAAEYATAALVAESYAEGGTIGNVHFSNDKGRDWKRAASFMWSRFEEWCGLALADPDSPELMVAPYNFRLLRMGHSPRQVELELTGNTGTSEWLQNDTLYMGGPLWR